MKRYENVKRIGMRIKSARALTGLNQSEFCGKYQMSLGAYKTWESGKFAPRMANVMELCRCFLNEGVFNVTAAWLLKGEGSAPTHAGFQNNNTDKDENKNIVEKEIEIFKKGQTKQGRDPIISVIADDCMKPFFFKDDIVGGVVIEKTPDVHLLQESPLLVEVKKKYFVVRWGFSDSNNLYFKPTSGALICRADSQRIGKVLWHRRF